MIEGRLPARYRVLEEVGQGGMAVVFRAHDDTLKREVAVKLLHAHLLAEPESKARLEREAQAVAKLQHDNIVQIFDYSGHEAPASYIVTEFIDGQTLKQFMAGRRPGPPELAAMIALEVASALRHAHELGIIHRDVKPENVMVRKDGLLKLMDFGVAQIMDLERMTVTGQLLGSPAYMAPEILEGKQVDVRTDVFSVGIMLYQLATGTLPFSGRNPHEVLKRIAEGKFADPRTVNRQISDSLAKIIARALARRPDDRYPGAGALIDDLQGYLVDAGLHHPREELRDFFTSPEAYEAALPQRMLSALVAAGKRARAEKRTARALELWNRALALDPKNQDVLGELRRLEGRQTLRRGALVLSGAVGLAAVGLVIFRWVGKPVGEPSVGESVVAAATKPSATAVVSSPQKPAPARPSPTTPDSRPARAAATGARPAAETSAPVRKASARPLGNKPPVETRRIAVELRGGPKQFEARIDGVIAPGFDSFSNSVLEVPWNRDHEITLSNSSCCEDIKVRVGPTAPNRDSAIVTRWKLRPAHLIVTSDPPREGDVLVTEIGRDGQPKTSIPDRLNEPITILFDGDDDVHKRIRITVLNLPGARPKPQEVEITAGSFHRLKLPIELND